MRSVSGARNRLLLIIGGIIALLVAVWLASGALGLADRWPAVAPALQRGDSTPADLAGAHQQWLLPVAAAVAVIAVVLGILLLLAQVPKHAAAAPFRITGEDATAPLGSMSADVLERALSEHAEGVAGVLDATVKVSGSTTTPWVQATVGIAQDAETAWVVDAVRAQLADDVSTVLGTPPRQVDLLLSLRSSGTSTRTRLDEAGSRRSVSTQGSARREHPALS